MTVYKFTTSYGMIGLGFEVVHAGRKCFSIVWNKGESNHEPANRYTADALKHHNIAFEEVVIGKPVELLDEEIAEADQIAVGADPLENELPDLPEHSGELEGKRAIEEQIEAEQVEQARTAEGETPSLAGNEPGESVEQSVEQSVEPAGNATSETTEKDAESESESVEQGVEFVFTPNHEVSEAQNIREFLTVYPTAGNRETVDHFHTRGMEITAGQVRKARKQIQEAAQRQVSGGGEA